MSRQVARFVGWGLALVSGIVLQTSAVQAQAAAEAHVAAARAAAGDNHMRVFEYLCRAPRAGQPAARPTSRPTTGRATNPLH